MMWRSSWTTIPGATMSLYRAQVKQQQQKWWLKNRSSSYFHWRVLTRKTSLIFFFSCAFLSMLSLRKRCDKRFWGHRTQLDGEGDDGRVLRGRHRRGNDSIEGRVYSTEAASLQSRQDLGIRHQAPSVPPSRPHLGHRRGNPILHQVLRVEKRERIEAHLTNNKRSFP